MRSRDELETEAQEVTPLPSEMFSHVLKKEA